ncbi:MAG: isoprenylcysteine carboxylmethyltransferase family protein [Anaerolineales bacterium]|nr:MAG: isoprenylcysteine carboxylmethyltransferase family protein [Anaerolineales bacterium]
MSAFYIILSLLLWGLVHSILASLRFKSFLANLLGDAPMRGYRLFYNVFSFLSFLPILYLVAALPDARLYSVSAPLSYAMMLGQGLMVILLVVGVLQTGMLTFAGLRQLIEGERPPKFITNGLYRFVRHPLYTAGILFLWLSPQVTVNSFTLYIAAMIYIFIGAYFEERKLAREFGAAYAEYRSKTPMFIPCLKG